MPTDKAAVSPSAGPQPNADAIADAGFIQDAYGEALKNQFQTLVNNYVDNVPDPETKFQNGLAIIRNAYSQALKSAAAPVPASKDADFIQDAYGDALGNQVQVLIDNYISDSPDSNQMFADGLVIIRKAREAARRLLPG